MKTADPEQLLDKLRDERSRRVVLLSHCLLNENTRYAGGATRPGPVVEIIEEVTDAGHGIHQLPCPERLAWGGVLKRRSLLLYHSKGGPLYALRGGLLRAFVWWTKASYRRLARQVARDVADYQQAGITVTGIVGIGASPSCGVFTTLDLRASLEIVAACPAAALTRDVMNERAVLGCRRAGEGLFIQELDRALSHRHLTVPAFEHDLAAELRGERQAVFSAGASRVLGTKAKGDPDADH